VASQGVEAPLRQTATYSLRNHVFGPMAHIEAVIDELIAR
jgi:hypothetical protein